MLRCNFHCSVFEELSLKHLKLEMIIKLQLFANTGFFMVQTEVFFFLCICICF